MQEIERLRAENRHLLDCLLRREGFPAVGQAAPTAANNPRVTLRQRATQLEAQRWREWYETVNGQVAQPKAQAQ